MPIRTTMVGDATGGDIFHADTVEYQGLPWLVVAGWLPADEEGWMRPVRIMRPLHQQFHPGGAWADYRLNNPIPKAVLEGTEPVPDGQYEVVEWPEVLVEAE